MNSTKLALASISALALSATAQANPIPVADLMSDLNIVVGGNFSTGSESVGPVLVGGNLSSTGMLNSSAASMPLADFGTVNVYGDVSGNFIARGDVKIGGTSTATILGAASISTGYAFANSFAADITGPLAAFSADLGALVPTAGFNPATSTFTGLGAGINVVDLTEAALESATGPLQFPGLGAADNLIVNVSGNGAFANPPPLFGGFAKPNVLFNFTEASSVTIDNEWWASILAPVGNVSNSSPIDGFVWAGGNYTGTGELHFVPPQVPDVPHSPVPEPSPLHMLGTALLALGVLWLSNDYYKRHNLPT